MAFKELFAALSILTGFAGYVPYLREVAARTTKPHLFSWIIWGVLNGTAFGVQITEGGGLGSVTTGFAALLCLIIVLASARHGTTDIRRIDWLFLSGALLALGLWLVVDNPLLAVIVLAIVDALGFGPSIIKAWSKPHEETAITFLIQTAAYGFGLLALRTYSPETMLFPIVLAIVNGCFGTYILWRRRVVSALQGSPIARGRG